jgi:hypothetical protein
LNFLIQSNDVEVRVAQQRSFRLEIERDHAGAAKGFHPTLEHLGLGKPANLSGQFGFDALAFERGN